MAKYRVMVPSIREGKRGDIVELPESAARRYLGFVPPFVEPISEPKNEAEAKPKPKGKARK